MPYSRRQLLELCAGTAIGVLGAAELLGRKGIPSELLLSPLREGSVPWGNATWRRDAIGKLWREWELSGPTPVDQLTAPFNPSITLLFKNEAKSVTGSLKHRVAWSLLMWGLIGSHISRDTNLYERTSGNTGIAEAYFARKLGLKFTAVTAANVSPLKLEAIRSHGGRVVVAPQGKSVAEFYKETLAADPNSYDLNQFANAEKAIAYFKSTPAENENLINELRLQLLDKRLDAPQWIVAGAGSGGTATSIGRYIRKWSLQSNNHQDTQLLVVDPERSVVFDWYLSGDSNLHISTPSRIEGVGSSGPIRFGETFSLQREIVDRMLKVPDTLTMAGMHLLSSLVKFKVGPSSGLNFIGILRLACELEAAGKTGVLATIICDDGRRYADTYYNPRWVQAQGLEWQQLSEPLEKAWRTGQWPNELEIILGPQQSSCLLPDHCRAPLGVKLPA